MKQVAVFDYNQRTAADDKLAELSTKNKGAYFLQVVKEPMPEPIEAAATEPPRPRITEWQGRFRPRRVFRPEPGKE